MLLRRKSQFYWFYDNSSLWCLRIIPLHHVFRFLQSWPLSSITFHIKAQRPHCGGHRPSTREGWKFLARQQPPIIQSLGLPIDKLPKHFGIQPKETKLLWGNPWGVAFRIQHEPRRPWPDDPSCVHVIPCPILTSRGGFPKWGYLYINHPF